MAMKTFAALLFICTQIALASAQDQPPEVGAGDSGTAAVPININMSKTQGNEAETAVAVSHTNPRLITTVSNLASGA